jgi:hypothetical protein
MLYDHRLDNGAGNRHLLPLTKEYIVALVAFEVGRSKIEKNMGMFYQLQHFISTINLHFFLFIILSFFFLLFSLMFNGLNVTI